MYEVSVLQKIDFGATGVAATLQNVRFALTTIWGTCPMDRNAGIIPPVDDPMGYAQVRTSSQIIDYLESNIPEIIVEEIRYEEDPLSAKLSPIVKVVLADGSI
ncbi:hypothetical protein [Niallia sp. 01092]|uniref:hypothetical protein n=1 Tax=unclassified Niallia TaxID=2837522 RepID=UPI003FD00EE3